MNSYGSKLNLGDLENWGTPEDLGAKTLEGKPQLFGRLDLGTFESAVMAGVYRATKGKFEVVYPYHEHASVKSGHIVLTDESGVSREFGPGDSWIVKKGETVIWDIRSEDAVKTFFVTTTEL